MAIASISSADQPLCFVINLKKDVLRYTEISARLHRLGISFERHKAIDGKRFAKAIKPIFGEHKSEDKLRPLTLGEMGCSLSHIGVLRRIVRRQLPYAVVLEDDADFCEEFSSIVKGDIGKLLDRYGIVKLEGILVSWTSDDGPGPSLSESLRAITPLRPSLGSASYAVSQSGARRLLSAFARRKSEPYDHFLTEYEWHGVRYAELRPFPAFQCLQNVSNLDLDRALAEPGILQQSRTQQLSSKLRWLHARVRRLVMWLREWTADLMVSRS